MSLPYINADVGEGLDEVDERLMPFIDWANIACGAHAGDPDTLLMSAKAALLNQVKIGAHPSYPDREHFGRVSIHMDRQAFQKSMRDQLGVFIRIMKRLNVPLNHIKPHGALYHDLSKNEELSHWFLDVIEDLSLDIIIVSSPQSKLLASAQERSHRTSREGFLDRRYLSDGNLATRDMVQSVITDVEAVLTQLSQWLKNRKVDTLDGGQLKLDVDTLCLHGDNPNAFEIARAVRDKLNHYE